MSCWLSEEGLHSIFLSFPLRKEMRNSFNSLIVVLTVVDSLFCILLVADFSFARAFEMHTVLHTILYPHFIYPITNIMLCMSIYMTVVLALER